MSSRPENCPDPSTDDVKKPPEVGTNSPGSSKMSAEAGDHPRSKWRGRRKRSKQRKEGGAAAGKSAAEELRAAGSSSWDSNEELEDDTQTYSDVQIRPINAPQAPRNSTQFIIDDHNECEFYMSFDTLHPSLSIPQCDQIVEPPMGNDAAYVDIDFEYTCDDDSQSYVYYDQQQFELSYKDNRFDELLRLSRTELIKGLQDLEARLDDLSETLVKENPSPVLEKLQADLLELQEKHFVLKEYNSKLTALLQKKDSQTETELVVHEDSLDDPQASEEAPGEESPTNVKCVEP